MTIGSLKDLAVLTAVWLALTAAARAADWPMWAGGPQRNMVNTQEKQIADSWDVKTGKNIKWVAQLGSQSYGCPTVADGKVFVGSNNSAGRQPNAKGDKGVELCFRESDGKFLWQMTHDKLAAGRVNDWPRQGICSSACVEGKRVYYVSNRCELVCADTEGFHDGKNDGPYTAETYTGLSDGDVIWKLDMIAELGVHPHNMSASSPVIWGDLVFVITGNGVDESHIVIPAPEAPDFLAVNKHTGEVVWDRNNPGERIVHGQWSSPAAGLIGGQEQVIFAGGDGRLYAFTPKTGDLLWSFQGNPKGSVYKLGGLGTKNEIIATPVIWHDKVYFSMGQDPEHGEGPGHLYAIDATQRGDITATGAVWHNTEVNRSLSTVAIYEGVLYHCDLSGIFRAIDPETGKVLWQHDLGSAVWSSPSCIDGKVYQADEDGNVTIFKAGRQKAIINKVSMGSSVYTTPIAANGVLFIANKERLYAIQEGAACDPTKVN